MVVGAREKTGAREARMKTHGVDAGRSHGGDSLDAVMVMINGDRADGGGALGADEEPMFRNDTIGLGGPDKAEMTTP